jgi:hypothetical protein
MDQNNRLPFFYKAVAPTAHVNFAAKAGIIFILFRWLKPTAMMGSPVRNLPYRGNWSVKSIIDHIACLRYTTTINGIQMINL